MENGFAITDMKKAYLLYDIHMHSPCVPLLFWLDSRQSVLYMDDLVQASDAPSITKIKLDGGVQAAEPVNLGKSERCWQLRDTQCPPIQAEIALM